MLISANDVYVDKKTRGGSMWYRKNHEKEYNAFRIP